MKSNPDTPCTFTTVVMSRLLLASCGGGGNQELAEPKIQEVTGQGSLVSVEPLPTLKAQDFRGGLAACSARGCLKTWVQRCPAHHRRASCKPCKAAALPRCL